eukprot:Sdes_comp19203_c0_seq1m10060
MQDSKKRTPPDYSSLPPSKRPITANPSPSSLLSSQSSSLASTNITCTSSVLPTTTTTTTTNTTTNTDAQFKGHTQGADEPAEDCASSEGLLRFQNRQLSSRLKELHEELRKSHQRQLECQASLEQRDESLAVVNRCWERFHDDILLLLLRVDPMLEKFEVFQKSFDWNPELGSFLELLLGKSLASLNSGSDSAVSIQSCQQQIEADLQDKFKFTSAAVGNLISLLVCMEQRFFEQSEMIRTCFERLSQNQLRDVILLENEDLRKQNHRLQLEFTEFHGQHRVLTENSLQWRDKIFTLEESNQKLRSQMEDLQFDVSKLQRQLEKSKSALRSASSTTEPKSASASASESLLPKDAETAAPSSCVPDAGAGSNCDVEDLKSELEAQQERCELRLKEIEELRCEKARIQQESNTLRMELSCLSEDRIVSTPCYAFLYSQYCVALKEAAESRSLLEKAQLDLSESVAARRADVDAFEQSEAARSFELREKFQRQEAFIAQLKAELDRLKYQLERSKVYVGDSTPLHHETRQLIASLQSSNHRLQSELTKVRGKLGEVSAEGEGLGGGDVQSREEFVYVKDQLRKSMEKEKELNVLLNVYKTSSKETRELCDILFSEKKLRQEVTQLRQKMDAFQRGAGASVGPKGGVSGEGGHFSGGVDGVGVETEELCFQRELTMRKLQSELEESRQNLEAVMSEMELIGKAYEDLQEQNVRLVLQLTEKDDSNFQLMSEQVRLKQLQGSLKEEKDLLSQKVVFGDQQREVTAELMKKLEEREKQMKEQLLLLEKDVWLKHGLVEQHKKKTIEAIQAVHLGKLTLEKQMKEMKQLEARHQVLIDQTDGLMGEKKRFLEEILMLKRKLDKYKRVMSGGVGGSGGGVDEILNEKLRTYKELMQCSVCHVRKKNCVLTKCFHCFCYECIQTSYETRQRKCPTCGDGFGANDFHQIFF